MDIKIIKENYDVSNNSSNELFNELSYNELPLYFLNKCGIHCNSLENLNGTIIEREIFLNEKLYNELKSDIPKLKNILKTTVYTATHKNASLSQQWPLLNLIRQILKNYNYQLTPKRVCNGYTKDKKKIYKRLFEIKSIN